MAGRVSGTPAVALSGRVRSADRFRVNRHTIGPHSGPYKTSSERVDMSSDAVYKSECVLGIPKGDLLLLPLHATLAEMADAVSKKAAKGVAGGDVTRTPTLETHIRREVLAALIEQLPFGGLQKSFSPNESVTVCELVVTPPNNTKEHGILILPQTVVFDEAFPIQALVP